MLWPCCVVSKMWRNDLIGCTTRTNTTFTQPHHVQARTQHSQVHHLSSCYLGLNMGYAIRIVKLLPQAIS
jgi:hypothetical protein